MLDKYKETYGREPYQPLSAFLDKYFKCIASSTNISQDTSLPAVETNMAEESGEQAQLTLLPL